MAEAPALTADQRAKVYLVLEAFVHCARFIRAPSVNFSGAVLEAIPDGAKLTMPNGSAFVLRHPEWRPYREPERELHSDAAETWVRPPDFQSGLNFICEYHPGEWRLEPAPATAA